MRKNKNSLDCSQQLLSLSIRQVVAIIRLYNNIVLLQIFKGWF